MADNKKQRTPEEMEKALAAANEALAQAKKEAEDAKEAAKAAEAVMRGMAAGEASDDGMVPFWAFKDDVKEVVTGMECGLSLVNYNDIQEGDVIETFTEIEVEQKL